MIFVWLAGSSSTCTRPGVTGAKAGSPPGWPSGSPLVLGAAAALPLLGFNPAGWGRRGPRGSLSLGIGMACAVTALPILILLMEKLAILRQPLGQRILRYASLDDLAIWGVLGLILLDWQRVGRQVGFMIGFAIVAAGSGGFCRGCPNAIAGTCGLIWLAACGLGADWSGLHYMVGAFLAGAVLDSHWFDQQKMDDLRHHVLLVVMPVFFLSTGLRTNWEVGGAAVFLVAAWLLVASVAGKLLGVHLAGRILGWAKGEASSSAGCCRRRR
jgi:Kef-type K+ transport system membrane component KefB